MNTTWTLTASAKSAVQPAPGSITGIEAYRAALDRGWDKVSKEVFNEPFVGEMFVRTMNVKRDTGKVTSFPEMGGYVPINRDEDSIPIASMGLGFDWEWNTYPFRMKIQFARAALEQDEVGFTKGRQAELLKAFKRSVEAIIADHFNRGFGVAGSARLSSDGMYYIDSGRPNPTPEGGSWSNLESTADLTEDTLFTAVLNASQQVSATGTLYPQTIRNIVIPPWRERQAWTLLNSEKVLGSNNNDANWAAGAFKMDNVIVYPYLTTDCIYYWLTDPKSEDNELILAKRKNPEVMTGWGTVGDNPDVLASRIRADFGLALGDPRKSIRGGLLQAS